MTKRARGLIKQKAVSNRATADYPPIKAFDALSPEEIEEKKLPKTHGPVPKFGGLGPRPQPTLGELSLFANQIRRAIERDPTIAGSSEMRLLGAAFLAAAKAGREPTKVQAPPNLVKLLEFPDLPEPELGAIAAHAKRHQWKERSNKRVAPIKFIEDVYGEWLVIRDEEGRVQGKGLARPHLATVDKELAQRLQNWLYESTANKIPENWLLPSRDELADLRELRLAMGLIDPESTDGARIMQRKINQVRRKSTTPS